MWSELSMPLWMRQGLKRRNTLADQIFYNTSNLTESERTYVSDVIHLEGAILVVHPDRSGAGIERYESFKSFRSAPGVLLRDFAVAGVGSSDLGAASLARTLANHVDRPVGAIVAGYGMSDLLLEALGGWFFFRPATRWLARQREIVQVRTDLEPQDIASLRRLLSEPERDVRTLVGHSKGSLLIAYVLHSLEQRLVDRLADTRIVTLGAVVELPKTLGRVEQYLGALDGLGVINSNLRAPHTVVPGAAHHLNTQLPAHLDAVALLNRT